ncbi:PR5-like receptor kinase [Triticum dicoccoides]|uniref:PR5-like receptor kinase n=1 Tax=Triticum dicoccoides TaxID=85692 RepID=UPI001890A636|nr:PR5-like receptor kinase [Triticum dicoccoides]
MAVASTSSALRLQPLLLILLLAATSEATTFKIINQCTYTVWPAALPGGGVKLDPGETWALNMPAGTSAGRIWPRTGCSLLGEGGSCQTGDCSGLLACTVSGRSPNTLGEFSLGQGQSVDDFFDISLIDGFNVPMDFLPVPVQGRSGCSKGPHCAANITSQCPREVKAPGGCNNPCIRSAESNCSYTINSVFFKMCPDAYSNPNDFSTFTCSTGTDYQVIFCPMLNQEISPTAESPLPAPPADVTPPTPSTLPAAIGPASMKPKSASVRVVVAILAPVGGFILFTIMFLSIFFICKQRTQRRNETEEEEEFGVLQGTPMRFTFQQLKAATEQFADKLGEGGFWSVFKGQFGDQRIAVKCLDRTKKSHRLLVYEYMPKGSLGRWIYCRHDNDAPLLDWSTRCKIITHVAKGLSCLHEECTKRIAHLDVKPQNILLDDNFDAKLSDFGLCKLIDRDMSQVVTRMRGTPGYLAPEWLTSQITEKADIYSFGVVVMEIISGRKNLDTSQSEESIHLITLLEEKVNSDRLIAKKRPKMSEVVKVLDGAMTVDLNIEHNFVVTTPANFGSMGNASTSAPPLASDVSGPRISVLQTFFDPQQMNSFVFF